MKTQTTIALTFALILSSLTPAFAGVPTADSTAWTNDGFTIEAGTDYRTFDVKGVKTTHIPEVIGEHGKVITPARDIKTAFTKNFNNRVLSGKVSTKLSSDVLIGVGYGGNIYGYTAVKNGNLVGSIGGTSFNAGKPEVFGSVAYSPIKNTAVFVDFRKGQTSYGVQQQMGNTFVYGSYSPNINGYAAGIGVELGGQSTKQAVDEVLSWPVPAPDTVITSQPVTSQPDQAKDKQPDCDQVIDSNNEVVCTTVPSTQPATVKDTPFTRGRG